MASDDNVIQVMAITALGEEHREIIMNALQGRDAEVVINEYYNDPDKFLKTYITPKRNWDESSWGASREGEFGPSNNTPSFAVHTVPEESEVIYGAEPTYYGSTAPSRPPSRVHNRSPMSNLVEMKAGGFLNDGPNNKTEEDEHLQRAMAESLAHGGHHPHGLTPIPQSLPPAPPLPQQSGVTDANKHFGPANRTEYNPDEWAMVPSNRLDDDPAPLDRKRSHDTPAFLRNRDPGWKPSRLGGIIMVLHVIPMARNALLRTGCSPDYGYGDNPNWWKGDVILPPIVQGTKDLKMDDMWGSEFFPPLSDELHRLVAFLDSTDRGYGTADILGDIKTVALGSGDRERGFFEQLEADEASAPFKAWVDIVTGDEDQGYTQSSSFSLLDSQATQQEIEAIADRFCLDDLLNLIFLGSATAEQVDPARDRTAMITEAPQVLVFRSTSECPWPENIQIDETLFLDRYMARNSEVVLEEKRQLATVDAALARSHTKELELTFRANPLTKKGGDCRVLAPAVIGRYQDRIKIIKQGARWRNHSDNKTVANESMELYLPKNEEPDLLPEEADMIAHYEARIKSWEADVAKVDRVMQDVILPEREMCKKLRQAIRTAHTTSVVGSDHKYSLRGVIPDPNTVFLRKREPSLMEMEENPEPVDQWWKMAFISEEGHSTLAEMTTFEEVLRQGCSKKNPILIFATDRAMDEAPEPLSDALKTFVRFDNRHFKQEISEQEKGLPDKLDGGSLTRSALRAMHKPRERAGSIDSMATNNASVGDSDEDMPDVPGNKPPGLVDVSESNAQEEQKRVERTAKQEMQERGVPPLIARTAPGATVAIMDVSDEP